MESALNSALTKGGRIVDLAYAAIVHQLGITQRFFPQGFGRLDLIDFHEDVRTFQTWPPAHFTQQLPWRKLVQDSYGGHGYKVFKASFRTPCQGRVYDALPPESRTAHAMLILPDKPAEGAPCVVHLAATGDHGYTRRTHLGLPLVQQGIATLALESPYYGERKPHYQQGAKLLHVSDLLLLGRATIEESLLLLHWLGQAGHERLGMCGLSMGGVHANMVASLYPGPVALTPLLSPRSASGSYCSGALYHATAWTQIVADLQRQEEQVLAALQHAGRGSELMGRARWWVDSRTQQQKAEAAEAQQREEERVAAHAAADASREVQAAAHAAAVQAASRSEGASGSKAGGGQGRRGASGAPSGSSGAAGQPAEEASSSFQWQATGRWAGRVSDELRSAMGQVERLERDHQHEAAVARLHAVLETYTDVTRFPKPRRTDAAVIVGAQQDAYVSPQSILELQQHLAGSEVRWVPGGHVTSFLLHHRSFRQAIVDSLAKLAQPPPLATTAAQSQHLLSSGHANSSMHPAGPAAAQQLTPLQGRNTPLPGVTDVYVSAVVDHLVAVNDADYRFEVVLYMLLTWRDPRARAAVDQATEAALTNPSYNDGNGCQLPCTTIYAWTANRDAQPYCCDDIWLPHFEFINVRGFSQDRVVRYGVRIPADNSSDAVGWWVHIQGEFYTPLQFRSFPFDKQYLSVQVQYGNKFAPDSTVNIVPSATGTQLYEPETGDKLSGWTVEGIQIVPFNLSSLDLLAAGDGTLSDPDDPWPLNPTSPTQGPPGQSNFIGYLWQNGFEIYIEVHRVSLYYVITAILPIYINTCLALLVFSVSPRHLDTRLGIVVTLFLSLTALQFIIAAGLPSSQTVVPTQQLIIVSYCILAGIGVTSILVFWMVSLHRSRERQRRLARAKRAFTNRWHSVTSSMGLAASAVAAFKAKGAAAAAGRGTGGAGNGGNGNAAGSSPPSAPSTQSGQGGVKGGAPRLRSRLQSSRVSWGSDVGNAAAAGAGAADLAAQAAEPPSGSPQQEALPASPFERAAGGTAASKWKAAAGAAGTAGTAGAAGAAALPGADSHVGSGVQLLPAAPTSSAVQPRLETAGTISGPQGGGMGVYGGGSFAERGSSGDDDSDAGGSSGGGGDDSDSSFHSRSRGPWPVAAIQRPDPRAEEAAAAAPALAADEEEGGPQPRWWRRSACCGGGVGGAVAWARPAMPGWLKLHVMQLRLMKEEMLDSQDYADFVARRIDKYIFWTTLAGFNIAVILIFAIQSTYQPQEPTP
ncbi:alpha beta- isoform C [Chlorella sorokiniana]|uniref:Alpha beta-isoform C n=1 Tax=Chlorella sorokiniana TaxID=3076 RepID=A0A2P6TEY1_CHLSO|nr:alpha beta- isoform C [Chlorella sorokiniana]|eukprot:PRW32523.1 alpha beta- isoform C [Chlorella sorokiniana]